MIRPEFNQDMNGGIARPIKERKKHDRFNGMPEEEVSKRTLPDHLTENLDIIIVSISNKESYVLFYNHSERSRIKSASVILISRLESIQDCLQPIKGTTMRAPAITFGNVYTCLA